MNGIAKLGGLALLVLSPVSARADNELVTFDVPLVAAAVPVEGADFIGGDVVEVRFAVTTLLSRPSDEVQEIVYTIDSPDHALSVLDFEPKQQLFSLVEGPIEVEATSATNNSLDTTLNATSNLPLGGGSGNAGLSGGVSRSAQESRTQHFTELAPKQLILAAGTVQRGAGVFFKLRPWAHGALEGRREFVVRFVAPVDWRHGAVQFHGEATIMRRGPLGGEEKTVRSADQTVGLYLDGNREAYDAAHEAAARSLDLAARRTHRNAPRLLKPVPSVALLRSTREVVHDVSTAAFKPVVLWTESLGRGGDKSEDR